MWGDYWGYLIIMVVCLLVLFFIINTVFLVIETYKETKAGVYGEGNWDMMVATSIPILLSVLGGYLVWYMLVKGISWETF